MRMAVKSEAAPRASIADTLAVYLQRRVLIVMFFAMRGARDTHYDLVEARRRRHSLID